MKYFLFIFYFFYTFGQSWASFPLIADKYCGEISGFFQHRRPHCLLKLLLKLDGVSRDLFSCDILAQTEVPRQLTRCPRRSCLKLNATWRLLQGPTPDTGQTKITPSIVCQHDWLPRKKKKMLHSKHINRMTPADLEPENASELNNTTACKQDLTPSPKERTCCCGETRVTVKVSAPWFSWLDSFLFFPSYVVSPHDNKKKICRIQLKAGRKDWEWEIFPYPARPGGPGSKTAEQVPPAQSVCSGYVI